MPDAVDLLAQVGADNYTVPQFIREAKMAGVSKRIPAKSIPHGIVPGVSRLFLWHSMCIPLVRAEGQSMFDLVTRLIEMGKLSTDEARVLELDEPWCPDALLLPADYVPPFILRLTCIIQDLPGPERSKLEKDFEIEWQGGCFAYTFLGQVQVVMPKNATDDDIPEHFRELGDEVEYVKVDYTEADPQATPLFDEED
jgi:hypothetical protein